MENRHPIVGPFGSEFPAICNHCRVMTAWSRKTWKFCEQFLHFFSKNNPSQTVATEYIVGAGNDRFWALSAQYSWRARRNVVFFVRYAMHDFTDSCRPNFTKFEHTRRSVSQWKLSEQNFENFTIRGRYSKKRKIFSKISNILQTEAAITLQWSQIARNSLPNNPLCDF